MTGNVPKIKKNKKVDEIHVTILISSLNYFLLKSEIKELFAELSHK